MERQRLNEAEKLFRQELNRPGDNARKDDVQIDAARAAYGLGLIAVARGDRAAALTVPDDGLRQPVREEEGGGAAGGPGPRPRRRRRRGRLREGVGRAAQRLDPWPDPLLRPQSSTCKPATAGASPAR